MPETRFHKGDLVKFQFGIYPMQGVVKEDRGPIGIGGRRLYLVEFRIERLSPELSQAELPAEQLQAVADGASRG